MNSRSTILASLGGPFLLLCLWHLVHTSARGRSESKEYSRADIAHRLESLRPPEGRIVDFAYAHSLTSAIGAEQRQPARELLSDLRQISKSQHRPWDLANLAVVELLVGDPQRSINLLEKAASALPQDARIQSDLSAAYLSRGRKTHNSLDLMRGLTAARKAIKLAPALQEATFNCAVALGLLQLSRQATQAWGRYLLLDSNSSWAEEAKYNLNAKKASEEELWTNAKSVLLRSLYNSGASGVTKVVERFSQPTQTFAAETLLPDWASAADMDDAAKAEQLGRLAKEIGIALARFNQDFEILDSARVEEQAAVDPRRRHLMAEAYQLYKTGRRLQLQYRPSEALPVLTRVAEELGTDCPVAYWATLYKAVALMDLHQIGPALETLEALSREVDGSRYRSLAGKIQWIRGMLLFKNSRPVLALDAFLKAIDLYRSTSAWEDLCAAHYLAAEAMAYLGNSAGSAEHLWRSLYLFDRLINPWRSFALVDELANLAEEEGLPEVALDFRDEVVDILGDSDDPVGFAHALRRRAETLAALDRSAESLADLQRALSAEERVDDPVERLRVEAATALGMGEAWLSRDPLKALDFLQRARSFYAKERDQFELPRTFLAQYRAYLALGDPRQAEKTIKQGISWYESQASAIADADLGESFASHLDIMFESLIRSELDSDHFEEALRYSERRRALLATALAPSEAAQQWGKQAATLSVEELSQVIPEDVTLLIYVASPERSIVWRVEHQKYWRVELGVGGHEISHLVGVYYDSLSDPAAAGERREALEELYDKVLAPVLNGVDRRGRLLIVPSGDLARLPLSAALDRRTGRYLVQDFAPEIAPSVLWVARRLRSKSRLPSPTEQSVLAVGNPAINRNILFDLSDLPLAATEARQIRGQYPNGYLFLGRAATRENIVPAMSRVTVVHIGAHALSNFRLPGRSLLALSPSRSEDTGFLRPADIMALNLSSVRLVVLGACRGANGPNSQTGSLNLVEPFLSAGAGSVIAGLWDVADSFGLELFPMIHQRIVEGQDPAEALRSAQLELLGRGNSSADPSLWGSIAVFGL
jgi:CHAT domain-containing protein